MQWVVRNGYDIKFWHDNWLGEPLITQLNTSTFGFDLNQAVSSYISNSSWAQLAEFVNQFPLIADSIACIALPVEDVDDQMI